MLLDAHSLGYSDGPSGAYVAGSCNVSASPKQMQPKTRLTSAPVAELVAEGEAEIGIQQIVAILPIAGAELVGPLPSQLQNIIVYAADLSAQAGNAEGARAFVAFMATAEIDKRHPRARHGAGLTGLIDQIHERAMTAAGIQPDAGPTRLCRAKSSRFASRTDLLKSDVSHGHVHFNLPVPPYFSRNTLHYGPGLSGRTGAHFATAWQLGGSDSADVLAPSHVSRPIVLTSRCSADTYAALFGRR